MIIVCKMCAARFESLIVLPERAIEEITKKITTHWTVKHKEHMAGIGQALVNSQEALLWYMTMTNLCFIPQSEEILLGKVEKALDMVMKAVGYDEGDDSEIDEDEDESDDDTDSDSGNAIPPAPADATTIASQTDQPVESIPGPTLVPVAEKKNDAA